MKRIYVSILAFAVLITIVCIGCKKNQDSTKDQGFVTFSAEGLSKDASFIELNDAMNRFDPKYLQLVFHDGRSMEDLIKKSESLIQQLSMYPDQPAFQKEMADFYHFSSVEQLKLYSGKISENLQRLYQRPELKQRLFSDKGGILFFQARTLYAKHKIESTQNGDVKKQANSLWNEMVDTYLSDFGYLSYVYDEGLLDPSDNGGGCNESCCWEYESCKSTASSKYTSNLLLYGLGGAAAYGTSGATIGSAVPFWGNVAGAIGGIIWGGATGILAANNIYYNDLKACKNTYNACLAKKSEK